MIKRVCCVVGIYVEGTLSVNNNTWGGVRVGSG